jgi:hypothetical protein
LFPLCSHQVPKGFSESSQWSQCVFSPVQVGPINPQLLEITAPLPSAIITLKLGAKGSYFENSSLWGSYPSVKARLTSKAWSAMRDGWQPMKCLMILWSSGRFCEMPNETWGLPLGNFILWDSLPLV